MDKKRIGIHGVPRSGTTWLGEIINSSPHVKYKFQPLFSYELKDFLSESSQASTIDDFFEKLDHTKSAFLDQEEGKEKGIIPIFKKEKSTHIVYKEVRYHNILENLLAKDPEIKIIAIIRNPLATMNSWLKSPREFRKDLGWSEMDEWKEANKKNQFKKEEFFGFEKWKEAASLFIKLEKKYQHRFTIVEYSNILSRTFDEVDRLFKFCELELTDQTIEFLEASKKTEKNSTYSVFRCKDDDDDWRHNLNKNIIEEIEKDLKDTKLEKYL